MFATWHDVTWISSWESYGISTIIFDTCFWLSGAGSFARSRNIGSRECSEQATTTCPCRSREVQLIRSSLKVISQARNRNHRRDRAIDYTSPRAVMFPAVAGATRYCCALSKSASMHLGIPALSTESSFFGVGGKEEGEEGGGEPTACSFHVLTDTWERASETAANWAQ